MRRGTGFPPPTYFLLSSAAMVGLHLAWPVARWMPRPWNLLGAIPLLAGLALAVAAARSFRRHGTTVFPFARASSLVTDGVFAFSRNPMYLGMTLVIVAFAIGLGTLTPLLVPPVFVAVISVLFVRGEERILAEQFGAEYERYRSRVRRWL